MLTYSEMLTLHHTALADTTRLVERAARGPLDIATPCDEWDLAALLSHMIGQNHGFAAALGDGDADVAHYAGPEVTTAGAVDAWEASATALREAFARAQPDAPVHLAEFDAQVSATLALGMQLLDTAVHAWDVAEALGTTYRPDDATVAFVLESAGPIAARPGGTPGVFAAPVAEPSAGDADPWFTALRLLGRDPVSSSR
ncbi:TIGR03086 family metal-binding protein [Promicromonospora sp. MEB111]|uniref:TIGR03086 family metal-binding protein n=1 Tax=Promicromonospora sp. MEB111 TaxID=3040301 RepID=UPI00254F7EA6|nr:TIGR03086 family metal-binding protein [Promicromonospora sp. MEB111]